MLQKINDLKNNLLLTIVFYCFTIGGQTLFYALHETLTLQIPKDKYFALFIILFIFSLIKQTGWRFISMGFIFILSLGQMIHLEFFGMPIAASEFYLLFTQTGEILGTIKEDLYIFIIPVLIVIPGSIILWKTNKRLIPKSNFKFLYFLFIFYFIYNPARTFVTGNKWGRQPSTQELDGMNVYISFSYFLGKILPYKLSSNSFKAHASQEIVLTRESSPKRNIIIVQGESLSSNHMSLFGYERKTTPFLESLSKDTNFISRRGISSGVSTDIAIAFFMNTTHGLNGNRSVYNGRKCLFKLAMDNKFETFYYSTQSSQQLRYITNSICPKYIQNYQDLEKIDPGYEDENKADDIALITQLRKINLNSGNKFIILHQRGSHSPYNLRYKAESDKFTSSDRSSKNNSKDSYDNSVFHFDLFMRELISHVKTLEVPTTVFVLSDHGEALGEEGLWGHGMLRKPAFEIPILFYTHLDGPMNKIVSKLGENPTHMNLSLLISKALGYKSNIDPLKILNEYFILGNDMDGFAGFLKLKFKDGKYQSFKREDI